jgi:serine/threonine-protein phosphatase 2A activator
MASSQTLRTLQVIDSQTPHAFVVPVKRINDGDDLSFFLTSKAYTDIMTFLFQLNVSMFPRRSANGEKSGSNIKQWKLKDPDVAYSPIVQNLAALLQKLGDVIDEAPPDPGPRRFGNISFRKWHQIVTQRISKLLDEHIPAQILSLGAPEEVSAKAEIETYLLGSFGSSQRLDYGTGHELSFLAFLGCLWKLGAFANTEDGSQERAIVLGVIEPYVP